MSVLGHVVAAAAVAALASTACGSDGPSGQFVACGAAAVEPSRVTIVGDSLSVQAEADLRDAIDRALVDACNGRTIVDPIATDDAIGRIQALHESAPEWWVVALGTNDAAYDSRPPETIAAHARQLLDAIGPDECIAWVLPAVAAPASPAAIDNVVAAQEAIAGELSGQNCHEIVDWPGAVDDDIDLLDLDGIHLTEDGQRHMAELIAEAIGD